MSCKNLEEIMVDGVSVKTMLENHMHWLNKDVEGWEKMRGTFRDIDLTFIPSQLRYVNFSGAILTNCDFSCSDLYRANFDNAILTGCHFNHAVLVGATFKNANIVACDFNFTDCGHSFFNNAVLFKVVASHTTFHQSHFDDITINSSNFALSGFEDCKFKNAKAYGSILFKCNLFNMVTDNTSFNMCNLYGSYIYRHDVDSLDNINGSLSINMSELECVNILDDLENVSCSYIEYRTGKILEEPIIGYKKCSKDRYYTKVSPVPIESATIVTLEIPKGAVIFSVNGDKFRTNKVKVLSIDGADRVYSIHNNMSYYVGDEITVHNFDCRYNLECASGIHFFMTKEEAKDYLI